MKRIKQTMLFFLALFYAGFMWGQGTTILTNFADAPYGKSDFYFQSGGIDFSLTSWNLDSLSYVDPGKSLISVLGGDLDANFNTQNSRINWVKIIYTNFDSLTPLELSIYGFDSTFYSYSQLVGVPDTFFYDASVSKPFIGFRLDGSNFHVTEVQYNWNRDFWLERANLCPGEKLVADFSPDSTTDFVEWFPGDGSPKIGNTMHLEYVYASLGSYPLSCVVHNYDQSIDTIVKMVSVNNSVVPVVNFWSRSGGESCPGDPVSFGVNGRYSSYNWRFGDGVVSTDSFPNHVYSLSGDYNVTLVASNSCGNFDSSTIMISVNDTVPAYADFWMEPYAPCPFQAVRFEAQNSGTFLWNFGDGSKGYMPQLFHSYKDTGTFVVSLVNQNGCGNSDTLTQILNVNYHPEYPSNSNVQAGFKVNNGAEFLTVCSGTAVPFANYSYIEQGSKYYWDFGDSSATSTAFEPVHIYQNPGYYNPTLFVTNNCGVVQSYSLSVEVSDTLMPDAMLMDLPNAICPGEKVYFWDDNFDRAKNYTYTISFGDSTLASNIVDVTTTEPHVLSEHIYPNLGDFPIVFTATNRCNNSITFMDTISVLSDTTRIPFYKVQTSAKNQDNNGPEDWGRKQSNTDAIFHVSVNWAQWNSTLNDNFYVAFWYGSIDLTNPNLPQPDGFVKIKGLGNVATAYIPFDDHFSTVGVAAFWSCSGSFNGDASAKGTPQDSLGLQITAFPYTPEGVTNISSINLGSWNGNCYPANANLGGDWASDTLTNGSKYVIHFFEQDGSYEMEMKFPDGKVNFLERGWYSSFDSLTEFYPDVNEQMNTCFDYGSYFGDLLNGLLTFSKDSDLCTQRVSILTNRAFHKIKFKVDGVCPGDPVFFQAYGGQSYTWKNGPDTISGQTVNFSYPAVGNYTVDLWATNACGRTDTLFNYVNVVNNKMPDAWFKEDKQFAFTGDSIQFFYGNMNDPATSNFTYDWMFGDGASGTGSVIKHTFANPGNYDVILKVTNGCGSNVEHHNISILQKPACQANFNWNIGSNDTVMFANTSVGTPTNYTWDFGDGMSSTMMNPVHSYADSGFFSVCLTIRDSINNCVNTSCQNIILGQLNCFADFDYFINNQTNEVSFTDLSQGTNLNWHWDFGDGYFSNMPNPVHLFSPGFYTVSLTVFNPTNGCQSTNSYDISIGQVDCHPEFSVYADSLSVEFYDESVGATEYYWDFGDGTSDSIPDPVHTYSQSGIYNVYFSIWNDTTQCFGDMQRDIQVVGDSASSCSLSFDSFVDSVNNATFNINSSSSFTNYYWDFGDGNFDTLASPVHNYPNPDIYGVCLTAFDSLSGCQADFCADVPVQTSAQACKADFAVRKGNGEGEFNFMDKSIGNISNWSWSFDDDSVSVVQNPLHTYSATGYYNVVLSIMDTTTGCFSELSKLVSVSLDSTTVACKADFEYFIDAGAKKITLTDKSLGKADTWYWTFGDGNYEATQSPIHSYAVPGEYTITEYIFNQASGCNDQKSITVKIGQVDCNLTADIAFMIDSTKAVIFKDKSIGKHNVSYWTFGDGSTFDSTQVTHQYTAAGYYLVTLSVIDDSTGCDDHTSAFVQVGENDCKADFEFNVDVDSLKVSYIDKSKSSSFHYWDFGDGNSSDNVNPVHYYGNQGRYLTSLVIGDASGVCWDHVKNKVQVGEMKCDAEFTATVNPNTYQTKFTNGNQAKSTHLYWQFGDGSTSTLPNPTYRYSHPGYYNASLYTNNEQSGCMDYQEKLILVGKEGNDCEADFYYQANASTRAVQFTDNSKGPGLTYLWDFGDGSTSTDKSPSYTFTDPGYQYVCLTVLNDKQISNMTCKDVQVGEGCLAQFDFVVDSLTVSFNDKSFGTPTKWRWEYSDSTSMDVQNPIKTFDKPGDYLVFLGIKNASGCVNRQVQIVSVGNSSDTTYSVGFAYDVDTTNSKPGGHPVDMYGTGKGDSPKAKWSFGDAQKRGYAVNPATLHPTYTYADTGTYNVCLTIEDPITGKSGTACHEIEVGIDTTTTTSGVRDLSDYANMKIYPNPANSFTKLSYSITKNMNLNIALYDLKGNRVKAVLNQQRIAGSYSQYLELTDLPNGTYFVEIRSDLGKISKKFVVRK